MKDKKDSKVTMYQREILKLLRALWKEQDLRMWQQIYTVIHCFCNMREGGVMEEDRKGIAWELRCNNCGTHVKLAIQADLGVGANRIIGLSS